MAKIVDAQNCMLVPLIIVSINYAVFSLGLVHVPVIPQPFTVPIGISGFIATGGDLRGSLLQFFDLAVSALLYYPFFKAWERVLLAREQANTQAEEARVSSKVRTENARKGVRLRL